MSHRSIDHLCVQRDACHQLFCFFWGIFRGNKNGYRNECHQCFLDDYAPVLFLSFENPKYSCSWTSACRKIDAFDYDATSGTLLNRRTIVKVDPSLGVSWFISSKIIVFWTYFKLTYFILCASLWRLFCQSFSLNQLIQWHCRMSYLHSERVAVLYLSSGLDRLWTLISVYMYL